MKYPHLATRLFNCPLLIERGKLQVIANVLFPRLEIGESVEVSAEILPGAAATRETSKSQYASRIEGDGIGVIEISGSLVNRYASAPSGVLAYDRIADAVNFMVSSPDVKGIMLRVDSYGGEVAGAFDLADTLAAAAKKKPMWCSVDDAAFSAAFLLASQAGRIYVTRTAGVGSVGVVALHVDQSEYNAKIGVKVTPIFAGAKKVDLSPHQPLSEETRNEIQGLIDGHYGQFVSYVANARNMAQKAVKETEAGLYFGQAGIDIGFADKLGTFPEAMEAFSSYLRRKPGKTSMAAASAAAVTSNEGANAMADITQADAGTQNSTPAPVVDANAVRAAAHAEAQEIAGLCSLAGCPERTGEFLAANKTPAQVLAELNAARAKAAEQTVTRSVVTPDSAIDLNAKPKESLKTRMEATLKAEGRIQ